MPARWMTRKSLYVSLVDAAPSLIKSDPDFAGSLGRTQLRDSTARCPCCRTCTGGETHPTSCTHFFRRCTVDER